MPFFLHTPKQTNLLSLTFKPLIGHKSLNKHPSLSLKDNAKILLLSGLDKFLLNLAKYCILFPGPGIGYR